MRTFVECVPYFLKQALEHGRLFTGDEMIHKEILDEVAHLIPNFSLGCTPPEMAREMHKLFGKKFGGEDLYKEVKEQSNRRAMDLYPELKKKVSRSPDPLLTAVELAIAGNVIDYAVKNTLNIEDEIQKMLDGNFAAGRKGIFEYEEFREDLAAAETVLYLADNAGEIVFDRVLLEELPSRQEIIFAVRDKPVINDALLDDALFCGIDKIARVISSGVDVPGTVLKYCSQEFLKIFKRADLIISKGQGNYEALSDLNGKIYFLFKVKCPVIARHSGASLGDIVLRRAET